jgi:hypothetical protein
MSRISLPVPNVATHLLEVMVYYHPALTITLSSGVLPAGNFF